MSRKVILCRCEDVALADVQRAVAAGYRDLEEVKRYTGFGTGPCQGKECLREVALAIAAASGKVPAEISPFTTRPPLVPTELETFASPSRPAPEAPAERAPAPAAAPPVSGARAFDPAPSPSTGDGLPARAEIAIVGAGVMGLALAYNLALRGQKGIVVVDEHYLAWGASGRNGGGVRQQWSTEMNIRLMQESVEICAGFAQEMGINVWMRRGGYLFLARTEATRARLERNVALQNRCDVPTRMIDPAEARALVPELDTDRFVAACYNASDGIVFPWPFLWGYARAAARRGVAIHTQTRVSAIERAGTGFRLVTSRGTLEAGRLVCAAGAWSPRVTRLVGVELPDWPMRHEILSTEPLKPFLKPMVSVIESGLYFSQSLRGEVVGGVTMPEPRPAPGSPGGGEIRLGSRLAFVETMARGMIEVMPRLGPVKVVRQWAGPYDISPDGNPLVGEAPGVPGLYVCCGFMGHGFMMAPVVARHYAAYLTGGPVHPLFAAWRPDRFAGGAGPGPRGSPEGDGEREEMIIG